MRHWWLCPISKIIHTWIKSINGYRRDSPKPYKLVTRLSMQYKFQNFLNEMSLPLYICIRYIICHTLELYYFSALWRLVKFRSQWSNYSKHIYKHHWDRFRNYLYHDHPLIDHFQINKHCFYINFSFTFVIRTMKDFPVFFRVTFLYIFINLELTEILSFLIHVFIVSFLFFAKESHFLWFSGDLDLLLVRLANGIFFSPVCIVR